MRKKGFTLIELLAVILILGIIALIAIPSVTKIIEESKKGAFKTTVQNLLSAAEQDCQLAQLRGEELNKTYTFKDGKIIEDKKLNIKGELPKSGTITVEDGCNVSATNLSDGTFIASKSVESDNIEIVKAGEQASVQAVEYILSKASEDELWDSPLEGDGYRYVGTNPNNYVCFGYTNVENDCDFSKAENTDKYAYRVIGIFKDSNDVEHVKLIKKEALNQEFDVPIMDRLNSDLFLANTIYIPDAAWANRITTWNYTLTNSDSSGVQYGVNNIQETYLHELNRSSKTSTNGTWRTFTNKISLMYVSDYLLSLGSIATGLDFKSSWMTLYNDDNNIPSMSFDLAEWAMTIPQIDEEGTEDESIYRYQVYYEDAYAEDGDVSIGYEVEWGGFTGLARPVFYLTSDTTMSGDGTLQSPFIVNK